MFHVEHFVHVILYVYFYTYFDCILNQRNGLLRAGIPPKEANDCRFAGFRGRAQAPAGG